MNRLLIALLCGGISLPPLLAGIRELWRGETLSQSRVCQKWGEEKLDISEFKGSPGPSKRAQMACSLLKVKKEYFGKDRLEIRKIFGDFDGFYFSDMFPTYMLQVAKKPGEDSWQIVFLLDRDEKVKDIIVHKNCCDD